MQTISKIKGGDTAAAVEYYTDAAAKNVEDYYLNKGEPPGQWKGKGCEHLGLKAGEYVDAASLQKVLDGYHAETGDQLAQNAGKDGRVSAFDIGFSAGKDLSTMAGICDAELRKAIIEAHQSQVDRAMQYMQENLIYSRRGKDGAQDEQVKGVAYANFNHMTSRGGDQGIDPLLHDHNLVINAVAREDGTFGTIDGERLYETKMAMGTLYRAGLVNEIKQRTGIELEVYETDKGHYDFRVVGIPDEVRKSFSQRRDQIEAKLDEWKASLGDAEAAQAASLQTRSQKDHVDRDVLTAEWVQRAAELGLSPSMVDAIANGKGADLIADHEKTPEQQRRDWAFNEQDGVYSWKQVGDGNIPAFSVNTDKTITFASKSSFAVQSAVQIGLEKGWKELKLSGSKEFRRQVWMEAKLAGFENLKGYRPTHSDIEHLEERLEAQNLATEPSFDSDAVIARLTDKNVRFSKADVLKTVSEEAMQKGLSVNDIEARFSEILRSDELVKLGQDEKGQPLYTTKAMYKIEQHLKDSVVEGIHDHRHHLDNEKIEAEIRDIEDAEGFTFSQQQRDSIFLISEGSGRISTINGKPGTGKSTTMKVINSAYSKEGYELIGCAIAGKAAAELEDGSGIKSQTLDSLLIELESGKRQLGDKTIIALDESGMVASEKMDQMVSLANKLAEEEGKIIHLVALGDIYQLQPVNAGPGAKIIQNSLAENGQETVLLDEIRRQEDQYARDAALDFSVGRAAEGLAEYYQRDKIQFYDQTERNGIQLDGRTMAIEGMVKSWMEDIDRAKADLEDLKAQGSAKAETFGDPISHTHMIALSRAEVYQANVMAHEHLKQQGYLGDTTCSVDTKFGEREFCLNERVIFTKNNKQLGTMNGWTGTVTDIDERDGDIHMTVLCDNGTEITFSNEEIKGEIDYGMCATNHKGQGLTKDYVQLLAGGAMTDMEAFNVELTHHRIDATIHINHSALEEMMLEGAPPEPMIEAVERLADNEDVPLPDYCRTDINACHDFIDQRPPTQPMIDNAIRIAEERDAVLPDDYDKNFSGCRAYLNDQSEERLDDKTLDTSVADTQAQEQREIRTLATLAELASKSRQKESTLEYLDTLQTADITQLAADDPRSKLTHAERLKIAMQITYEKNYKPLNDDEQLPDFDAKEQKVIRRFAKDRLAESVQSDNPLDQQSAYRVAAKDWMAMRSIDRREELRKDSARDFVKERESINKKQDNNIYRNIS
ncbi:MAG: relaxase domain-containing protein [Candidatus Thiodiazotropha endolucinida]|nr:relaxase domain-containing protein [Candidatus Thiodiazotropha taylori]MCW4226977.1 relaxase domain-containing protein [Candidatus Thiodiazotropha endolucinida]MCG7888536.1 relaxase domain-containing protein [Candidatus Thiodiazotropha taylori]MCG8118006.1 relaxase domain-containing protein [Candidatus Thiodiazotropha taylori]MCW4262081.1 relaxase domain-containing protein [Candidatus Thiodiazotropha endolucinida]